MSNVAINIAAEFVGKPAFKQAETSTDKLTKNVKNLAKTLGVTFGAQQLLAFGKASIKAAAQDEKAQKQLALALKNVGLGRDASSSEDYIQRLQSEFGVLDDKLRPAYQTLAIATRDSTKAQQLLNLSLDIAASTGKDLSVVSGALSKAFLGNNTALSKLGVGISKADLKAGNFNDIVGQLTTTFAGAATSAANTFQGSIDKLGVASTNVKEIIGGGLIDAFKSLGDANTVDDLAKSMQDTAMYTADVIRGIGVLADKLNKLPGVSSFNVGMIPILGSYLEILRGIGVAASAGASGVGAQGQTDLARLQSKYAITLLQTKKKITSEEAKALANKKLSAAIDKANLALGKGTEVFDMDKIQVAAALVGQAEALGKATSAAQVLAIANDTARLKIKQDILILEDAIASKNEAAITSATNKLNADLKVLNVLSGQNVKLLDIKSVLDSLVAKDLINLTNLQDALKLLGQINLASGASKTVASTGAGSNGTGTTLLDTKFSTYVAPLSQGASSDAITKYAAEATARANHFADLLDLDTKAKTFALQNSSLGSNFGALQSFRNSEAASYNVTIQANTIANPDELVNLIQEAVIKINRQGDRLTQAGSL